MRLLLFAAGLLALTFAGCGGPDTAKVKGRILDNGQPKSFPPTSHSVEIAALTKTGEPDPMKTYTCVVNEDGTFEMLASGGQLPTGTYLFTIRGPAIKKKGLESIGAKRELKGGMNPEIELDLAKPSE